MTEYTVEGGVLHLTVEGMDKLWALRSHLQIPLADITGVEARPDIQGGTFSSGLKVAGARIPGVFQAGTFVGADGMVFWDVHGQGKAIVISLQHEHYNQLVVDVADPQAAADEIGSAVRASR